MNINKPSGIEPRLSYFESLSITPHGHPSLQLLLFPTGHPSINAINSIIVPEPLFNLDMPLSALTSAGKQRENSENVVHNVHTAFN